ncbi:putative mitochondrial protein [Cucumis melo var. makuwa]|uniref:Mitochondrial protein n=1 Tax=Cucumis melo var. makuwa TaxID=1194695 RepID=A0A5A7TTV1_CUCMM|nr:putative mitochondrial protein [Cucumis melo var. makuwa]TYK03265.1 putative mitochondrial protein [Cucumis melo var. makuwa]
MPWGIKTPLFYLFSSNKALFFSISVPTPLNKRGVLSANIATFLTQYVPSFFLPHVLINFGVKQLLHLFIPSTIFLLLFFRTSLNSKDYIVLLSTTLTLKSLVMLTLFFCILIKLNHVPASVVFLAMTQSIKVFFVGILFPTYFEYLAMSHFGSTLCSLAFPPSIPPSLVLILSFTDTTVELFLLSESTPDIELSQSAPAPANLNLSSVFEDGLKLTLDTPRRCSTQMDVKNAFFNGALSEEVYMKPPLGTSPPPHKVCLLCRALYSLKQALRAWFATFSSTITQLGFTSSPNDTALFTRRTPQGIVLLLLYVDDMIIIGNYPQTIFDLQHYLSQHFEMKDLAFLNYFFGLEVSRRSDWYLLSQAKYAYDLLTRSGIIDSDTASTPLDPNVHLTPYDGVPLEDSVYGYSLNHPFYCCVTYSSLYQENFRAWTSISSQFSLVLFGYYDADWTGDPTDRRSTIEYCTLADATAELLWLRWLLTNMGVP